jgi:hypothetical protein
LIAKLVFNLEFDRVEDAPCANQNLSAKDGFAAALEG